MNKRIYFDLSATTPIDNDVADYMHLLQKDIYGNPSSIHREGQSSKAIIEKSRKKIAKALNSSSEEIIFTSGGSESNNMVLKGILNSGDHFITSSYEHPAILEILPYLKSNNIQTSIVDPDENGIIQPSTLKKMFQKNTKLVSIMYVNNELGTINPINEISTIVKNNKILFHTDAVQALGKVPIDMDNCSIDFLSMSAHKLYGPKGVGALFIRSGCKLSPLILGGNQESNLRASTENIIGIAGFGMACEMASNNLTSNNKHIVSLEEYFINCLNDANIKFKINGSNRVAGVFNLTFPKINGKMLVMQLDIVGVGISFGAACSSGTVKPSNMLLNMGLKEEDALSSVRISFGKIHSRSDINFVVNSLRDIIRNQN